MKRDLKGLIFCSPDHRIVTVTLNPVIDKSLYVPDFRVGRTVVIEKSESLAAGKGVNISRALKTIGIESIAVVLLPSSGSEKYMSLLEKEGIKAEFIQVEGEVRTNITILRGTGKKETHLREKGFVISKIKLSPIVDRIKKFIGKHSGVVILSGSIPAGIDPGAYGYLIKELKPYVELLALDSSGTYLKHGIEAVPDVIKPNIREAEEVTGEKIDMKTGIKRAFKFFKIKGIKNIFISLGRRGIAYSPEGSSDIYIASVDISRKLVNTVGSGDASLAGGIAGIMGNLKPEEIASISCAAGAANTLTSGAGNIDINDLHDIYSKVKVKRISL